MSGKLTLNQNWHMKIGSETDTAETKLSFVIQIMQGVNGLLEASSAKSGRKIDLDQFVMSETDRGRDADAYIRELRHNDRF